MTLIFSRLHQIPDEERLWGNDRQRCMPVTSSLAAHRCSLACKWLQLLEFSETDVGLPTFCWVWLRGSQFGPVLPCVKAASRWVACCLFLSPLLLNMVPAAKNLGRQYSSWNVGIPKFLLPFAVFFCMLGAFWPIQVILTIFKFSGASGSISVCCL